jgi:hypothetical protein
MNACIFCGRSGVPLGTEDVIPRWVRRNFNIQGPLTASACDLPGDSRRQVGRRMDILRIVLEGKLCADCNSGWLGGTIEKPAARLITPMAAWQRL